MLSVFSAGVLCSLLPAIALAGPVTVDYTRGVGGSNSTGSPDGLMARATFDTSGTTLTLALTNISIASPAGAEVSDSLLVSIGFDLPSGITIQSGDSAVIAPGSIGLGAWSGLGPGDDVTQEWLWTNDAGGDLLEGVANVISTSNGQGAGSESLFGANVRNPNVRGPFGGIAAASPIFALPHSKRAVSDTILFQMTLTDTLTMQQLTTVARGARIEFGSDYQYLEGDVTFVPLPVGAALASVGMLVACRRRRTL